MVLLGFLTALNAETLLQIRREILGEDDATKGAEEDVDSYDVRRQSPTAWALLRKYGAREGKTDWTTFLHFLEDNMAEIDFKTKNGYDFERLDIYLNIIQRFTLHAHRLLGMGLRNNFSNVNNIAKAYLKKQSYPADLYSEVFEKHWRAINKVDDATLNVQLQMKEDSLTTRMENNYKQGWDEYVATMRKYSRSLELAVTDMRKEDAVKLLICVEGGCCARKSEVLDPLIKFYTWKQYHEKNKGLKPTGFILGDQEEGGVNLGDEKRALKEMGEERILIQIGKLKDPGQRDAKYELDPKTALESTMAIIRKPCLIFSAAETCAMVKKIRQFFGLTRSTRSEDVDARRKLGALIGSRDVRPLLARDWPNVIAHADKIDSNKKEKFSVGTHYFRACASQFLVKIYADKIEAVSGRTMSIPSLLKVFLVHSGSVASTMSYANVKVEFPLSKEELTTPDRHLIRLLQSRMDALEDEILELRKVKPVPVEALTEDKSTAAFIRSDGTIVFLKKNVMRRYGTTKKRDEVMDDARDRLSAIGHEANETNMGKLGFGHDSFSDWKNHKPLKSEKQKSAPPAAISERPLRDNGTSKVDDGQLEYGEKVLIDTSGSTQNAARQKLKRAAERYGEENITEECEGEKKQKVFTTDKGTTLKETVCVDER